MKISVSICFYEIFGLEPGTKESPYLKIKVVLITVLPLTLIFVTIEAILIL